MSGQPTETLQLSASPTLAATIVAIHGAGAACVALVLPGVGGGLLAGALLALGLAAAWSRALLRSRSSVRAIELRGPALLVALASGERMTCEVAERRYVSRLLVTLPLRTPRKRTLLVTRDMLGAAEFRRLRMWALWGRLPGVAAMQLPA